MKQTIKCLAAVFAAMLVGVVAFAQVTTSSLNGYVADEAGEPLIGAAIVAVHLPSGTQYATIANESGRFNINGMRAGGPYKVEVSFLGMATVEYNEVYLKLGEPYELNIRMQSSNELDAVVLTADASFNATKTGAAAASAFTPYTLLLVSIARLRKNTLLRVFEKIPSTVNFHPFPNVCSRARFARRT